LGGTRRAFLTPDNPPDGYKCFRLIVPSGDEWEALARGALASLLDFVNWEQWGNVPIEDCLDYWNTALFDTYRWRRCMEIGSVFWWAGAYDAIPDNCLVCNGVPYDEDDYPELFAVIGTTFGTGGSGQFCVPDLLRKFIQGYGIPEAVGDTGGNEETTLTTAELPAHSHTVNSHTHTIPRLLTSLAQIGAGSPVSHPALGSDDTGSASPGTSSEGSGQAFENRPPYLCLVPVIVAK
jgi:microcystin-dependent protein